MNKKGGIAVLCRLIVLVYSITGLLGCRDDEVRGIFIARFTDDSALFLKRIAIPDSMDREFRLSLVNKKYTCELRVSIPLELAQADQCDRDGGNGTVICSNAREVPVVWKMTSCHGGFGRSIEGLNLRLYSDSAVTCMGPKISLSRQHIQNFPPKKALLVCALPFRIWRCLRKTCCLPTLCDHHCH
jgi:hypothetical protein